MIKEPLPQEQPEQQAEEETLYEEEGPEYKRKGKKKLKKALAEPSRDCTPSPMRRARKEAAKNKLIEEA